MTVQPEHQPIPEFDALLRDSFDVGHWHRLLCVRCVRPDRTLPAMRAFLGVQRILQMSAQPTGTAVPESGARVIWQQEAGPRDLFGELQALLMHPSTGERL
jgi:hypothetical protein